jgi:hypothetical protein
MKETYYKIFDQRGRLALVTPTPALVNKFVKENQFAEKHLNLDELEVGESKSVTIEWIVQKVKI